MAGSCEDSAVRSFVAFGLKLIGKLIEFQNLDGAVAKEDEVHDLRLQLEAIESALQDEVARQGIETEEAIALDAALSVAKDLKIRFDFFCRKLRDAHQVREFKGIVDAVWPRDNVEELDRRLSTIRATLS
jgi:hypothetical protein